MRQWEITLEYYPGGSSRKAHWYWQVCGPKPDTGWDGPILGAGRAESLVEATDEISSVVDVDLNNDWV